jgi:crotonobetainyl-CoA:carnitine CoA-transferase CaiB-like acyl-CoA transferase
VEVPLLDAQVGLLANQAMNWLAGGVEPGRMGNAHPSIAPYESYRAADGPLAIGVGTDRQFARLAEAVELAELAKDQRFATNAARVAHREELKQALEGRLAGQARAVWLERLAAAGVPAAPINSSLEVFANPLVRKRLLVEVDGVAQVRSPLRLDGQPALVDRPPPALGQDTVEVLRSLGLSDADLAHLRDAAAI